MKDDGRGGFGHRSTNQAALSNFSAFFTVVWLSLPFTRRDFSRRSLSSPRQASATFRDFRGPPCALSEKYLVNVFPPRLMHKRQPSKAAVSYVKRVRFGLDFMTRVFEDLSGIFDVRQIYSGLESNKVVKVAEKILQIPAECCCFPSASLKIAVGPLSFACADVAR